MIFCGLSNRMGGRSLNMGKRDLIVGVDLGGTKILAAVFDAFP